MLYSLFFFSLSLHLSLSLRKMYSLCLDITKRVGKCTAEDTARKIRTMITKCGINPALVSALTADTDATMNRTQIVMQSVDNIDSVGCAAHLLELTTGIAFKDTEYSGGVMQKCRDLTTFFAHSTQATAALLSKQTQAWLNHKRFKCAVTTIQDVKTRWWSTFQQLARLERLRDPIISLVNEGIVPPQKALTPEEWIKVANLRKLLNPFMLAQKVLEGEKYATGPIIVPLINKIRQHLNSAIMHPQNSEHMRNLTRSMLDDFTLRWGHGHPGTIWEESSTRGPRQRAKVEYPYNTASSIL